MSSERFCERCRKLGNDTLLPDTQRRYEARFQFLVYPPKSEHDSDPDLLGGDTHGEYCPSCMKMLVQFLEEMGFTIRHRYTYLEELYEPKILFPEQFADMGPFKPGPIFDAETATPEEFDKHRAVPNKNRRYGRDF